MGGVYSVFFHHISLFSNCANHNNIYNKFYHQDIHIREIIKLTFHVTLFFWFYSILHINKTNFNPKNKYLSQIKGQSIVHDMLCSLQQILKKHIGPGRIVGYSVGFKSRSRMWRAFESHPGQILAFLFFFSEKRKSMC